MKGAANCYPRPPGQIHFGLMNSTYTELGINILSWCCLPLTPKKTMKPTTFVPFNLLIAVPNSKIQRPEAGYLASEVLSLSKISRLNWGSLRNFSVLKMSAFHLPFYASSLMFEIFTRWQDSYHHILKGFSEEAGCRKFQRNSFLHSEHKLKKKKAKWKEE